jgi:hypothetical protein
MLQNRKISKFHFPIERHVLNIFESEKKYIKKIFREKRNTFLNTT